MEIYGVEPPREKSVPARSHASPVFHQLCACIQGLKMLVQSEVNMSFRDIDHQLSYVLSYDSNSFI